MAKETVEILIEGGKATAAPPLGPALGPMGVNIGQVVADINKKTASFKGMQVPVKVNIDKDTKEYTITIGTPPASALVKQECGIKKAASNPKVEQVADLRIEQVIKIAKMKEDALLGKDLKEKMKEILGTCRSMGVYVEGVRAQEAIELVNSGKFDKEIKEEKTDLSVEEQKEYEEEQKQLQDDIKNKRAEYTLKAKNILATMKGKSNKEIEAKMKESLIPDPIIKENLPDEDAKAKKK
ncbi:50S ribosomal protein L11 [Candidatus Woesearchaeota archaeon]|jgi:large subunit ribosomal protein L11|nr:50S ribosomal protein L11 [Candidatus Woesearchaeota archaeon]